MLVSAMILYTQPRDSDSRITALGNDNNSTIRNRLAQSSGALGPHALVRLLAVSHATGDLSFGFFGGCSGAKNSVSF